METIQDKIVHSARWTFITEIMAKLVQPISNMILARLLAPDAFGVLATVLMVLSLADMLSDAGFQKYIIQRDFKDEKEKHQNVLVAIWSNVILAILVSFTLVTTYKVVNPLDRYYAVSYTHLTLPTILRV